MIYSQSAGEVPVGGIIIWSGSEATIPAGYLLCDGNNGTRDLRNLFVVGAGDTYAVTDSGGAATHTLTIDEMPAHTHSYLYGSNQNIEISTDKSHAVDGSGTTGSTGGGSAHNNLPPYYALCYIQRV